VRNSHALAAAAIAIFVGAAVALAGPPGKWTPLSKGQLATSDEAGIVRTADGVLHVAWERRGARTTALWQTRVGADGRLLGSEPIVPGLSEGGSPELTAAPDGALRAFFFVRAADGTSANLRLATAPAGGGWTVVPDPLAQAVGAAVPTVGAAAARDGTPVVAWPVGTQVRYRYGVDPGAQGVALGVGGCCALAVQPAVDQITGQAYIAWASTAPAATGVFVQAVARGGPTRPKVFATGSATKRRAAAMLPSGRVALTARIGAPGVYLAYTSGYPKVRGIYMLLVGARRLTIKVKAPGAAHAVLAAAPQGRLWLAWSRDGKIYAARTNREASRLGGLREIPIRRGSKAVAQLQGDGSSGALDLVANLVSRGGSTVFWHQQVLPGLSLKVTATTPSGGPTRYAFRVTDAGEPVANATVTFGKQTLTTGLAGTVVLATTDHPPTVTASKLGYASAQVPIP
jgi:hypothetical protein